MLIDQLTKLNINLFIEAENIRNDAGYKLDFREHLFLWDIYNDLSPRQVVYKAAQVGFSTMAIIKSLWIANSKKVDVIYTLPTQSDVKDFVSGKVNRLVANNLVFAQWVKDKDTIEQKRVGSNVIYYRGTWTEKAAIMVSSDLNIYDEEDRSKQEVIQQYASRLQHSKLRWEWHFSNPSVPGNGVSRYWDKSDQKHWFIKCNKCNKEQYLDWPESIDIDNKIYVCKFCGQPLSEEERRKGRWVKKYLDREYSGYWISQLMCPWISAANVVDAFENKSQEYFYNFVLGLPYIGEGNTITPDILYRNLTDKLNSQNEVIIGCDSGLKKHYVMGNKEGLFYYGMTENWDDIRSLLKKYQRSVLVVDALPDLTEPRKLREEFNGRVYLCHYAKDRKTMQMVRWGQGKEQGNVIVDRNRMIQLVIDEFADMRIPLQGNRDDWADYDKHWGSMYRMQEKDSLGVDQMVWESSNDIDHWVHATVYWRAGMERFGQGKAVVSGVQGFIESLPGSPTIAPDDSISHEDIKKLFKFDQEQDDWRNF